MRYSHVPQIPLTSPSMQVKTLVRTGYSSGALTGSRTKWTSTFRQAGIYKQPVRRAVYTFN